MRIYNFAIPSLSNNFTTLHGTYAHLMSDLMEAPVVHVGEWQGIDTSQSKIHGTHELEDVSLVWSQLPDDLDTIVPGINHSWADDHFLERVSGIPHNPAPSASSWPYAVRGNGDHTTNQGKYDHTYPERFWPKHAGLACPTPEECRGTCDGAHRTHKGIRFAYGDLNDVVDLLVQSPLSRQAFLPVWFPEDTGAGLASYGRGQRVRVPCTLGYHFMIRDNKLTTRYYIRSCDAYRHMSNDIYLAAMLARWVTKEVVQRTNETFGVFDPGGFELGGLIMHISSLHVFTGDRGKVRVRVDQA